MRALSIVVVLMGLSTSFAGSARADVPRDPPKKEGCGCTTAGQESGSALAALFVLGLMVARRR